MEIYEPSDDSFMFASFLKKYLKSKDVDSYLDVGTGSGILAKTALKFLDPEKITALDINESAIRALESQQFKTVHSNLFEKVGDKFDLITFNAPYLPLDPREPKESQLATTGGKNGDEISLAFLKQAKKHLNSNGRIFLLISSLTPQNKIKKLWPYEIVKRKKLFQEELLILEFKK